jgi:hypothetical protein
MAKQGQHNNDGNDPDVSRGLNNHKKSTEITTGTPKKQTTYQRQAREHKNTNPLPQDAKNEWHEQTPRHLAAKDGPIPHRPLTVPEDRSEQPMPNLDGIGRSLYDVKDAHRRLRGLSDDELKRTLVVPQGDRLQAGAIYLDLEDDNAQPFTARGDETAGPDDLYIPKRDVDYVLWNRLTGVSTPERLDQPDASATPG